MALKKVSVQIKGKKHGATESFSVEVECDDKFLGGDNEKIKGTLLNLVKQVRPDLDSKYISVSVGSWSKK